MNLSRKKQPYRKNIHEFIQKKTTTLEKQQQTSNACHFDTSLCYAKVTATNLAGALPAVVVFYQFVKI